MITINEAIAIAQKHLESEGEIYPGIRVTYGPIQICQNEYYFDYHLLRSPGTENIHLGGAPGFIVDKQTGISQTITFGAMNLLQRYKQ